MQDTRLQDYKIARTQKTTDYKITLDALAAWGPEGAGGYIERSYMMIEND